MGAIWRHFLNQHSTRQVVETDTLMSAVGSNMLYRHDVPMAMQLQKAVRSKV